MPHYTILVPLYREAAVVGGLVSALERLDYPEHLLDVKLLIEPDDPDTLMCMTSPSRKR
jgi:cellulose synthase/poly-beta-1,6-N-acetylglucosamine synthase-like glycosyltransferase